MPPKYPRHFSYLTLAVWPEPWYLIDKWHLRAIKLQPDGKIDWFDYRIPTDDGFMKAVVFDDYDIAKGEAHNINNRLLKQIDDFPYSLEEKESLKLKATKAVTRKDRLASEERLMLHEGIRRHKSSPRPTADQVCMHADTEIYRASLHSQLTEMPYLTLVKVSDGKNRRLIAKERDDIWSAPHYCSDRAAKFAYRAKIANAFNFSATNHWGKTKAAIREMLLPRANQLLQLASVQRLLAEYLMQGKKALIFTGYAFWYEESDGRIGWQVKELDRNSSSDGNAIWSQGTIISKNHGRIIVLPYTKGNGDQVKGYTKNAPHDGPAEPRHDSQFVEVPFEVLDGDLMIGLFGELPYE